MAICLKLFAVLTIATLSLAQEELYKSKYAKKFDPEDIQTPPSLLSILQSPDAQPVPAAPSLTLELPREDVPIPFYSEPATVLRAPFQYSQPIDYNAPVPSQELQVPSIEPWNPDNDPKLYFELPAIVTKQEVPTNAHPKKYIKDIYEKQKPLSAKPKQEISLLPISEREYLEKQKSLDKVALNLAKVQNQKFLEKTQPSV